MNQNISRILASSFTAGVLLSACATPSPPAAQVSPSSTVLVATTDVVTTIATASTPASPPTLDVDAGLKRVEALLDNAHKSGTFTGAALIAQDGKIIFSKAWGLADRNKKIPNTPSTIFRVGETTTQFTAAATLLLEQDGKLSVQDLICKYLDDCPETWKTITIHHLLSHTSGIPDYLDTPGGHKIAKEGATPQQIVALFHDEPLAFKPGEQRAYSHSGFVLAGLIIERVSGQSYGDFVKQRIFEPLGMTRSGYGEPSEGLAMGYASNSSSTPSIFDVSALYAAGGCYSTAEDLYRWSEGLYTEKLLNAAELKKMLTSHIAFGDRYSGQGSGYGIVLFEFAKHKGAGNGGGHGGYSAAVGRYLDDRVTTLLIGNQEMDIFDLSDQEDAMFFGTNK